MAALAELDGLLPLIGLTDMVVMEVAPCNGVFKAPEKHKVVACLGSCKDLASLLEIKLMEAPESKSALATICLLPSPVIETLLVIIRQLGKVVD